MKGMFEVVPLLVEVQTSATGSSYMAAIVRADGGAMDMTGKPHLADQLEGYLHQRVKVLADVSVRFQRLDLRCLEVVGLAESVDRVAD